MEGGEREGGGKGEYMARPFTFIAKAASIADVLSKYCGAGRRAKHVSIPAVARAGSDGAVFPLRNVCCVGFDGKRGRILWAGTGLKVWQRHADGTCAPEDRRKFPGFVIAPRASGKERVGWGGGTTC